MKTLEFSKQWGRMICQLEDEYYQITKHSNRRYSLRLCNGVFPRNLNPNDGQRGPRDPSESIGSRINGNYDSEDKAVAAANDYHSRYSKRKEGA